MNDMTAGNPLYPLAQASLAQLRFHEPALARHGQLALFETFGRASIEGSKAAADDTLWLLFSNTKVITAMGIWALVEDGLLSFNDCTVKSKKCYKN